MDKQPLTTTHQFLTVAISALDAAQASYRDVNGVDSYEIQLARTQAQDALERVVDDMQVARNEAENREAEKRMTQNEIAEVLEKHTKWLRGEDGGARANLARANLADAYLARASAQHNKFIITACASNYQMAVFRHQSSVLVTAGCRRGLTIDEAREHWSPPHQGRMDRKIPGVRRAATSDVGVPGRSGANARMACGRGRNRQEACMTSEVLQNTGWDEGSDAYVDVQRMTASYAGLKRHRDSAAWTQYAAAALTGLMANDEIVESARDQAIARRAASVADALLTEQLYPTEPEA